MLCMELVYDDFKCIEKRHSSVQNGENSLSSDSQAFKLLRWGGAGVNALNEQMMSFPGLIISVIWEVSSLLRFRFVNFILAWGTFSTVIQILNELTSRQAT